MQNRTITILLLAAAILAGGCESWSQRKNNKKITINELTLQAQQLQKQLGEKQSQFDKINEQLTVLRNFPADRLKHLIHIKQVKFGRFTQAYDENRDGVDDGLVVYIELLDGIGDRIKAAGEVDIELWDLAGGEGKRFLQKHHYTLEELQQHWLSGFMTDHFKFKLSCNKENRSRHTNLTVKLQFKDALTGEIFEIQKLVTVNVARPER